MFQPAIKFLVMTKYPVQADFAEAVESNESRVSRAIRGRTKIRADEADRWAAAIGCDVGTLAPITRPSENRQE